MENNRLKILTPIALGLCLALGLFLGRNLALPTGTGSIFGGKEKSERNQKMQDIIDIIDNYYVDSVDGDKLFEQTISDMLHKLDPHSNYISAADLKLAEEQITGEFYGVGVRFLIIRDTICITNVIPNSPSEKAGILAGDKFVKVDNKNLTTKNVKNDDVMNSLKGPKGTAVSVVLIRDGKRMTKKIVRGGIPISSISASYMIDNSTGFIRIDQFSMTTYDEFVSESRKLLKSGMKKLILDVRDNPGGVLPGATKIADEFLKANKLIVSTKGLHTKTEKYMSTTVGLLEDVQVVVLINQNSASASEILAGALQDNDRATIVGRRSFGKGLVQQDMKLRDKSSLRLTVARYYTPTGRSIQKPYNGNIDDYYHDEMNRFENGELYAPDSSLFVDSLKYKTQKGKIVYGGGGIMPDKFVPLDTAGTSWYASQIRYIGAYNAFTFDFVKDKRTKWTSATQFSKSFQVSDKMLDDFTKYCSKYYDIKFDASGFKTSKEVIRHTIKAEIARQLWTEDGFYTIINQYDKEVQEALKQF